MKTAVILVFVVFFMGCASLRLNSPFEAVEVRDGLTRDEANSIVTFVKNKFDTIKGRHLPQDAKLEEIYSVSKWHTPGMPEGIDLDCDYSVNFYRGPDGYNLCISVNAAGSAEPFEVLQFVHWIH